MYLKRNEIERKLEIINAISSRERPTMRDIHEVTKIPVSTIKRLIKQIHTDFGVEIVFVGERGRTAVHGGSGYYSIYAWGVIERFELPLFLSSKNK